MLNIFPSKKKKHFLRKIDLVEMKMWDLEFRKEELRNIREGIRIEYDRLNEKITMELTAIEDEKKKEKPDTEAIAKVQKMIDEQQTPDLNQLKAQLDALDQEIEGEANPESLTRQVEQLVELKKLLLAHVKTL